MKRNPAILLLALFGFSGIDLTSQETRFFMPVEIQKAYEKNTRSYDGQPGANYWQNTVDYTIRATIVPSEKLIDGSEEVVFYNNSPDEINKLVVRLYQDVYKKGNPRLAPIDERDINEGVELSNVTIDGVSYDLKDPKITQRKATNIFFQLKTPMKTGSKLTFQASWKLKIPAFSRYRTGAYDSTSFFIGYWYPQIAVYDDIFGWDELDYLIRSEFYNNLGNYNVEITVPEKYAVWATGTFVNAAEVLPDDIFIKYQLAKTSGKPVNILSIQDIEKGFQSKQQTWHFTASDVNDFALAVSDHYSWEAVTQPVANHKVFISSIHPADTTVILSDHVAIQQKAIQHFSEDIPGIPYPYEAFTTFIAEGAGGMEFPMMANNGGTDRRTTIHEMAHSYFPMVVRTNERRWAWMDEGWANYITRLVSNRFFENDYETEHDFSSTTGTMGTIGDLPLITSTQFLTDPFYRYASYQAPEMVYAIIHQYLGDDLFLKCFREYIKRWAKKSPTPYDFFYTFENVSGKDLSWLWKPWFFEYGVADLAIQSFDKDQLKIINKGNKPVPVFIEIKYKNGEVLHLSENAFVWANGRKEIQVTIPNYKNAEKISVNKMITDVTPADNFFPSINSLYKDIDHADEFLGHYIIEGHSIKMDITNEDGLFYVSIPYMNLSMIIYPTDKNQFRSLDGSMNIKFNIDGSGSCKSLDADWNGHYHAIKN
jgi:Peptidase family M1 domain